MQDIISTNIDNLFRNIHNEIYLHIPCAESKFIRIIWATSLEERKINEDIHNAITRKSIGKTFKRLLKELLKVWYNDKSM